MLILSACSTSTPVATVESTTPPVVSNTSELTPETTVASGTQPGNYENATREETVF